MKKFFTLLMVVLVAFSTQAQTLRVGTNDSKADQAPIYVTQADRYYCTQIIYSADNLTAMQGKTITKLAFFLKAVNTNGDYSGVEIRLKIVDYAAFTEKVYESIDDAVLVFNGTLPAGSETELEVTLNEPFLYESGHLLVDVRKTVSGGKYAPTGSSSNVGRFQATYTEGVYTVLTDYNSSAVPTSPYYQNSKRPDIKFTYSDAAPVSCAKVNTLTASDITAGSATLTWTSDATNFQFVCVLKGETPVWDGVAAQALKTVTLDTLKSNTEYDFYVRSFCSDTEQGVAKKVSFKTDLACYAPTLLAVPEETITSESAVVSWHASGKGETQYQYTYGAYNSTPDWSKATLTSELSATLTGLNAASPYQVWVRSYCSADDQSDALTEYFTTKCGAVALPFNDDFSNGIDCWTTKNLAGYSGVSSKGEFAFAWAAAPPYQTIITPTIIASEKQVSVTFQYKALSKDYTESFKVGYSTTTNDLENAFTWSDSVKSNSTSYETYFDILPAGVKYVAIQCWSNDQYYLYIDDFSVAEYEAPKCPAPAGLAVTNIAAKTATLAWVSEATAWNYQLSADGENWGEAKAAATNPFDLDNLKANTLYYARVQADCGENGTSEWTEAISFTTDCGALSLPYAETFESTEANKLPNCWARVSTDEFPVVFADGAFYSKAYEGSKSLKFYGYEIDQIAVLPILEEELSKVELSFYYTATNDADAPIANVGYITDLMDATSFVAVKTLDAAESYTQAKITFAGAPANASIAIQYKGGDFFGSLYVDNLEVTEASEIPTAIDNTTVTNSAVKRIANGQVIIEHNGTRYTILGTELK